MCLWSCLWFEPLFPHDVLYPLSQCFCLCQQVLCVRDLGINTTRCVPLLASQQGLVSSPPLIAGNEASIALHSPRDAFHRPPHARSLRGSDFRSRRRSQETAFVQMMESTFLWQRDLHSVRAASQQAANFCPILRFPTSSSATFRAARMQQTRSRVAGGIARSLVAQQFGGRPEGGAPDSKRLLFVGNLPWVLDSYGLRKLFEPFGKLLNAQIAHDDQNDRSMGYGHVLYEDEQDARTAIREMDKRDIGGRAISVHFVRKQPRVTAADSFDFGEEDDRGGRGWDSGRGGYSRGESRGVDARAMRFNPGAAGGSRYATPVSQEKLAYQYARDFMDSDFLAKLQDPRLQLDEDAWLEYPVDDDDDAYEWDHYKLTWYRWDPNLRQVVLHEALSY